MASGFANITKVPELRKRIFFTLALLAVYRIGCFITTPGVDRGKMANLFGGGDGQGFLNLFNFFSGGALEQMSIFALGIMPYISASIIFQLLAVVVPTVERLQKEGEQGRRKINQWTRYLTLGISIVQGMGMAFYLQSLANSGEVRGLVTIESVWGFRLMTVLALTTGAVFIMWLGEQINERGIGNGISLVIFAGIVARLPSALFSTWEQATGNQAGVGLTTFQIVILAVIVVATIGFIVFFERAQRRIPIQHAKRMVGKKVYGGQSSFLPLKVNTAGVIPPIFASSILMFPATVGSYFPEVEWVQVIQAALSPGDWRYAVIYTVMIVFFCFFYTAVVFNPVDVADNLKKNQASIPGIRPGKKTAEYIDRTLSRITVAGSAYIAAVCLLPMLLIQEFQVQFYFGGTALLIVVGVALDTVQQIEVHLITRHYEGFSGGGSGGGGQKLRGRNAVA